MANILAIDTTGEFGSIALVNMTEVIEEVPLHSPEGHAHILFDQIARLLARHSVSIRDIDCFASASGPGSFTGVRVGLTAAKGLAETAGKRVVAVSNLRAVASFGDGELRAAVLDARRGEVYAALFDRSLVEVLPERVTKLRAWLESLPGGDIEFITPTPALFAPAIAASRHGSAPVRQALRTLAGAIGRIAAAAYSRGLAQDPAAVDANYVRRSDAELFWTEK
jgi:tRNA threonylcarbamoyladenosine biosynthesis protein TsaB